MPFCKSCAAPLPAFTSRCDYCGVKNDVDLQGISGYTVAEQHSGRNCPLCNVHMETIGLEKMPGFNIEKCTLCRGLFFDPEELNLLLDKSVDQVYGIDAKKIWSINQMSSPQSDQTRGYIRCPVCNELMNRVNFALRSGVVIDQCRHGVWLDNGELRKLLEWRKAGGQLLHEQIMAERMRNEAKTDAADKLKKYSGDFAARSSPRSRYEPGNIELSPIIEATLKLVGRLFV